MGNSLLDFVMALVRDPDAAARYAADPSGVLAGADLSGVTTADVDNLIPVVADSLAMTHPDFGGTADAANVWTSGVATAALDAFGTVVVAGPPAQPAIAEPVASHPVPDVTSAELTGHQDFPPVETPLVEATTAPQSDPADWIDHAAWPLPEHQPDHHTPAGDPHHGLF